MEFNYGAVNKVLFVFKDTLIFKGKNSYVCNDRNLRIWVQKGHGVSPAACILKTQPCALIFFHLQNEEIWLNDLEILYSPKVLLLGSLGS